MRSLVAIALLMLGSFAALAQPAAASCLPPDLAAQIARADVIAAGRVTSIGSGGGTLVFQPVTIYKGTLEGGPVTVATGPGGGGGVTSVDYRGTVGDQVLYLMGSGRSFSINDCSGSHAGPPTADEARLLGTGTAAPPASGGLIGELGLYVVAALLAGATTFYLRRREAARKVTRR
ncbi:MAG TPA: hypothetical protein VM070_05740 [Candidatus Saccharimonadales bacterium]|nr:hypothetical protein [Candidatus Saccharimonadales bacterium]